MRILVAHSRYLSGSSSGENRVVDDEVALLREGGHDVVAWTPEAETGARGQLRAGRDAIWSARRIGELKRLVEQHRTEIVHFHNLFPTLSPATLRAAADSARVVMTLHNYRLLCLPATLLRDGRTCEDCLGRVPWRGVVHRCYRGSLAGSVAVGTSLTLHRAIHSFDRVASFLAPSLFVRDKHIAAGFPPERIVLKRHFVREAAERRQGPGRYFLYLGRLSPEKGVDTVVAAWRPGLGQLLVVGDGPESERLAAAAPAGVEFRPAVAAGEVPALLAGARAVVVPSRTYEGSPRVVLEAYAAGVPVVASDLGGLGEAVREEISGRLVPPGDLPAWDEALGQLGDDEESERLGAGARACYEELYTPAYGLRALEGAYAAALGREGGV